MLKVELKNNLCRDEEWKRFLVEIEYRSLEIEKKIMKLKEEMASHYDVEFIYIFSLQDQKTKKQKFPLSFLLFGGETKLNKKIIIGIDPLYEINEEQQEYLILNGREPTWTEVVCDLFIHEVGHREYPKNSKRGCPYEKKYLKRIYKTVFNELSYRNKENYADTISNEFMNIINNSNIAYFRNFAGMVVGRYEEARAEGGKFSLPIDFITRVEEELWMPHGSKEFLEKFHTKNSIIENLVKRLFNEWGIEMGVDNLEENLKNLLDRERWDFYAKKFAQIISLLL